MKKKMGRLNAARKTSADLAAKLAAQKKEMAARNKRIKELEAQVAAAANVASEQAHMILDLQKQIEDAGHAPADMDGDVDSGTDMATA